MRLHPILLLVEFVSGFHCIEYICHLCWFNKISLARWPNKLLIKSLKKKRAECDCEIPIKKTTTRKHAVKLKDKEKVL